MLGIYPKTGALKIAAALVTLLSTGSLKLFKNNLTLTPNTTKAELAAAEADFSGYAAEAITAPDDAYIDRSGGASVIVPTVEFVFDGTDLSPTTNLIYGWWLEDTDADLFTCGKFDEPIPMAAAGDALPLMVLHNLGRSDIVKPVVGTDEA